MLFCFSSTGNDDCIRERKYTWHDSAHTKIKSEYWLCNGVLDSTYKEIDSKGRIVVDGKYKQGKRNGEWIEFIPQNSRRTGVKTVMFYDNDFLTELRRYSVENGKSILCDFHSCYIKSTDTILIQRMFDTETGFMTSLDSLVNGQLAGNMYTWSSKTGHLIQINGNVNTPNQYEKLFLKNGGYELIQYHKNMAVREKQIYNCEGVLVNKQLFDTLGMPFNKRK